MNMWIIVNLWLVVAESMLLCIYLLFVILLCDFCDVRGPLYVKTQKKIGKIMVCGKEHVLRAGNDRFAMRLEPGHFKATIVLGPAAHGKSA